MKKFLSLILALSMLLPFALSSCSTDKEQGDTDDVTGSNAPVSGNDTDNASAPSDSTASDEKQNAPDDGFDGLRLTASADGVYDISDNLFGIFLEDINFAVDGGLYAEMVCNRSFEFGKLATLGAKQNWNNQLSVTYNIIDGTSDETYLNSQNPHYARVTNSAGEPRGLSNSGFFGDMALVSGGEYKFTVYARPVDGYAGGLYASLVSTTGTVYAEGVVAESLVDGWHKYALTLTSDADVDEGVRLFVKIDDGTVDIDMVSLFPADTYKGRENGLRRDIAEMIEALHPNFLRFPGGCIIEGVDLDAAYSWKDSIGNGMEFVVNGETTVGDVATRPLGQDIWADESRAWPDPYYMTYGLGFYEYFLFCEDLGCEPIPVLNCGYSCQGQAPAGGPEAPPLNSDEFKQYVQDALDLVEFCLGDTSTKWGAVRAAMGHPEKFELHYLAIGNEQYGDEYNRRYAKFREAFEEAKVTYPELFADVKLIMANGLTSGSRDGWDAVAKYGNDLADALDEHYYNEPSWFLMNTKRYDTYDREGPTVFVGEYAAKSNTSRAAMAEAAYMTSLERNGDIVELAAYAPLLAYDTHTQWSPDLIWYDNTHVWGSVNYYVQKIYADNQSKRIIPSVLDDSSYSGAEKLTGSVGVGTWATSAIFDDIVVTSNKTGEVLYSEDFDAANVSDFDVVSGNFSVHGGKLLSTNTNYPANDVNGDVIMLDGPSKEGDYTLTLKATKRGGAEGFLIPFAVRNSKNYWHWNIGGWGNTVSCLEYFSDGLKSGQVSGTVKPCVLENNHEYEIKIVLDGCNIKCYLDGEFMVDFDASGVLGVYSVVGEDDDDIIVKLVNTTNSSVPVRIDLSAVTSFTGGSVQVYDIDFGNTSNVNTRDKTPVSINEESVDISSSVFDYTIPRYSMRVIRIPK